MELSLPEEFWCPKCGVHNRATHPGLPGPEASAAGLGATLKPLCPVCQDVENHNEETLDV